MILEVAVLDVIPSESNSFERDFAKAALIISKMKGCQGHQLLHKYYDPFPRVEHYELVVPKPIVDKG